MLHRATRVTLYAGGWKQGGHSLQLCGFDEGDVDYFGFGSGCGCDDKCISRQNLPLQNCKWLITRLILSRQVMKRDAEARGFFLRAQRVNPAHPWVVKNAGVFA